jgi:hypothetical protein
MLIKKKKIFTIINALSPFFFGLQKPAHRAHEKENIAKFRDIYVQCHQGSAGNSSYRSKPAEIIIT